MQEHDCALLALAALIIAAVFAASPNAAAIEESIQVYRIDLSGLSRNVSYWPEEEFPPH